jgi:DNA-binding response OmpR family regulator
MDGNFPVPTYGGAAGSSVLTTINSSRDILELLHAVFDRRGIEIVNVDAAELLSHADTFVERHRPSILLFEVAPPYEENWAILTKLRGQAALASLPVVITTTNVRRVTSFEIERIGTHVVVEVPYDPETLGRVVVALAHDRDHGALTAARP